MKKIVVAALFSFIAGSTSLVFPQAAFADPVETCYPAFNVQSTLQSIGT
ncbi:MAG: hypothetical protein PUP93_26525 [Rhizonema sp. NSF051]|nr:hypothetical protein [Rhizonema sp. NSF051]